MVLKRKSVDWICEPAFESQYDNVYEVFVFQISPQNDTFQQQRRWTTESQL